jgi:hypothetical protein
LERRPVNFETDLSKILVCFCGGVGVLVLSSPPQLRITVKVKQRFTGEIK